jgi:hypothetical protein
VGELQDGADEPERGDRPERYLSEAGGDMGALRQRVEPRSRAEYAADLEQQAVSGWDRRPFGSRMGERLDGTDASGAADGPSADGAAADRPGSAGRPDTPLEVVRRFEPRRAGLPEISAGDAAAYIDAHRADHPWLAAARGCSPEVQRIFAALDQGGGHAHIRHEGWVTEEMNERRVAYLEDPAQPDPAKRAAGIDGLKSPERLHRCRDTSSRITNPDAFATAIGRAVEHPDVRTALETPFRPGRRPSEVVLPIADLLGPEGYEYCTGWRLEPMSDSMEAAADCRDAWVGARRSDHEPDVPEPQARPIATFEGGTVVFAFGPNRAHDKYEIVTMYPRPPRDQQERRGST